MNKHELIDAISSETGASRAEAGRFLDAVINQITKTVADGNKVTLRIL